MLLCKNSEETVVLAKLIFIISKKMSPSQTGGQKKWCQKETHDIGMGRDDIVEETAELDHLV